MKEGIYVSNPDPVPRVLHFVKSKHLNAGQQVR